MGDEIQKFYLLTQNQKQGKRLQSYITRIF